ncbi:unnamed protein product [Sphagnum troendelagicum]|uniref:ABC transmembrane type-1 domain-containing protein n=1 Tax=Sphagnum troendelagicum TaxID=128251 RepID=A0ABP0TN69_9BRYO
MLCERPSSSDDDNVGLWDNEVFTFILTLVELVLMCGLLAQKVSGKVAAIVLVTFTTYVVWTVHITTQVAESHKEVNKLENLAMGNAVDALLNYETVKQFNNQKLEVEQYNNLCQGYQNASTHATIMQSLKRLSAALNGGQALILALGIAAVMSLVGLINLQAGTWWDKVQIIVQGMLIEAVECRNADEALYQHNLASYAAAYLDHVYVPSSTDLTLSVGREST